MPWGCLACGVTKEETEALKGQKSYASVRGSAVPHLQVS